MNKEDQLILGLLASIGAVITDSHIVYTSGKHGSAYVNKDAIYPDTRLTSHLCFELVRRFDELLEFSPDVIAAPAIGGVILSQWVAHHYNEANLMQTTLALYADKNSDSSFSLRRGYDKLAAGKRVLVVEDVLNTGGSAVKTVEGVRKAGGDVIAVGAICNRGGVTAQELGVPCLLSLLNVTIDAWEEKDCPRCIEGVPINLNIGHGAEYLARKNQTR